MIILTIFFGLIFASAIEGFNLKLIDCSKPGAEGTIIIFRNASWLECKGGKLSIEYCIAEIKGPRMDCVPHGPVKKGIDEKASSFLFGRFAVAYYFDSDRKYAHCYKIQKEQQDKLLTSKFKKDCVKDMPKEISGKVKNDVCNLKGRKVYYAEEDEWYSCKNGVFQLQGCMKKKSDTDYKCISKKKIENALDISNKRSKFAAKTGSFCKNFFANSRDILKNYESELTACNSQEEETAAVPTTTTTATTRAPPPTTTTTTSTTTTITSVPSKAEKPEPPPAAVYDTTVATEYQSFTTEESVSNIVTSTKAPIKKPAEVRPYLGSQLMRPELEKCQEQGVRSHGIWYQCNIPSKCVVEHPSPSPMCLSFAYIKPMYSLYQRAFVLGSKAGWDENRFNRIYGHLKNSRNQDLYHTLKNSESGNYALFDFIAHEFTKDAPIDKNVTIVIKNISTKVSPTTACEIVLHYTPFKQTFLETFYQKCEIPPVYVD